MFRNGTCAHFTDSIGFSTCVTKGEIKEYMFMEKADTTLDDLLYDDNGDEIEQSYAFIQTNYLGKTYSDLDIMSIQVLFAIAALQKYQIVHGDLHIGNVFLERVTENTTYRGEKLLDADLWCYKISGKTIYTPKTMYIAKIGDFGRAIKYSTPMVGDILGFEEGWAGQNEGFEPGPSTPNWFSTAYDVYRYLIHNVYKTEASPFIETLVKYSLDMPSSTYKTFLDERIETLRNKKTGMAKVNEFIKYQKSADPLNLLSSPIMKDFYTKPDSSMKVVCLGSI